MVLNATFNNISAISWLLVLLVVEIEVPGKNHLFVASHWQTLSHICVSSAPRSELTTSVVIYTDCTGPITIRLRPRHSSDEPNSFNIYVNLFTLYYISNTCLSIHAYVPCTMFYMFQCDRCNQHNYYALHFQWKDIFFIAEHGINRVIRYHFVGRARSHCWHGICFIQIMEQAC